MPAYRSPAEAEIRDAVVAKIRHHRPNARIIHEINVSSHGPNRMDLIAVDRAEIIAVEIKSAKDKLDRLPSQMLAMKQCSHHAIAAIHEKFLVEMKTNDFAAHYERDGDYFLRNLPVGIDHGSWVFPERWRAIRPRAEGGWDSLARWAFPNQALQQPLPSGALDLLWRDELQHLCGSLRVSATNRSTMPQMVSALRWHCTGRELTLGICRLLRLRQCTEADPPIATDAEVAP